MQTIWSGMKVENIEYYGLAVDKYIALLSYKMKCCVYNLRSKTLFVPNQQYFIMSVCLSLLLALPSYKFLIEYSYTMHYNLNQNLVLSKNDFGNFSYSTLPGLSVELTFLIVHFRVFPLSLEELLCLPESFEMAAENIFVSKSRRMRQWLQELLVIRSRLHTMMTYLYAFATDWEQAFRSGPHLMQNNPYYTHRYRSWSPFLWLRS